MCLVKSVTVFSVRVCVCVCVFVLCSRFSLTLQCVVCVGRRGRRTRRSRWRRSSTSHSWSAPSATRSYTRSVSRSAPQLCVSAWVGMGISACARMSVCPCVCMHVSVCLYVVCDLCFSHSLSLTSTDHFLFSLWFCLSSCFSPSCC